MTASDEAGLEEDDEPSDDANDAARKLDAEARKLMASDRALSYGEALKAAAVARPELADAYTDGKM